MNQSSSLLFSYYAQLLFRKLKWNLFINRQKFESRLIQRFEHIYGKPEEVLIGFGDHQQGQQMRYQGPTKDIGIRRLFRRNGYLD